MRPSCRKPRVGTANASKPAMAVRHTRILSSESQPRSLGTLGCALSDQPHLRQRAQGLRRETSRSDAGACAALRSQRDGSRRIGRHGPQRECRVELEIRLGYRNKRALGFVARHVLAVMLVTFIRAPIVSIVISVPMMRVSVACGEIAMMNVARMFDEGRFDCCR